MRSKLTILAMMFIALVSCNTGSETSISFHVEDTQLYPEAVLMTKDSIYKQALTSNNSTTFTLPEKFEPAYGAMFFGQKHVLLYIEPGSFRKNGGRKSNTDIFRGWSKKEPVPE